MPDDEKKGAAVYVGWVTFKNALEQLAQGVPNRIDRTCFPGLAGGVQSQLLAALKFLELIDDDGRPTKSLQALASAADEAARKEEFKKVLQEHYADLFALDLTKTTPGELAETIANSYNVSGDTRKKAIRFFITAVNWVGLPMSKLLQKAAPAVSTNGASTPTKRRRTPARSRAAAATDDDEEEDDDGAGSDAQSGTSRTVTLQSGGTLTIAASLDVLRLSASDRKFVFELIDALEAYEQKASAAPAV